VRTPVVPTLVSVTVAPGITALVESVTWPEMLPNVCAETLPSEMAKTVANKHKSEKLIRDMNRFPLASLTCLPNIIGLSSAALSSFVQIDNEQYPSNLPGKISLCAFDNF